MIAPMSDVEMELKLEPYRHALPYCSLLLNKCYSGYIQDRNRGHLKCAPICPEWQGILFYAGLKIDEKVFEQFPFPCEQCGGGGWAQKTVASGRLW